MWWAWLPSRLRQRIQNACMALPLSSESSMAARPSSSSRRVKGWGLVHRVVVALIRLHLLHAGYVRQIFAVRKGIEHVLDIDHFHGDSPWFSQLSASVSARKCAMTRNIDRN